MESIFVMDYHAHLENVMRHMKRDTPDEKCEHLTRSIMKMKRGYIRHAEKRNARTVMFLDEAPKRVVEQKHVGRLCQSTTLKGKKCTFRATCGMYCKKHSVSKIENVLGKKPVLN
jgi:hypothetical protein